MNDHETHEAHDPVGPAPVDVVYPSPHDPATDAAVERRRRLGAVMIVAGVLGLVVAVIGTIAGWQLIGDVDDTSGESIEVTLEALDSVEDTIDLSEQVLDAIRQTVATTEASLTSIDESLDAGGEVIGEVSELTATVGPTLSDVARVLRQLEDVGTTIDGLLGDLSSIPFGPDYDPDQTLGDTIGRLAATVDELPEQFESTTADLAEFDRSVGAISGDLGQLSTAVGDVRSGLDESTRLLGSYRANIADARALAENSQSDVDRNVGLLRFALVIGGFAIALGQVVPLWLGRRLRSGDPVL